MRPRKPVKIKKEKKTDKRGGTKPLNAFGPAI